MSVQSPFAERRARLGIVSRPVIRVTIGPKPAPASSAPPAVIKLRPETAPAIGADQFAWAHKLAEQYSGDASAIIARGEWKLIRDYVCAAFQVSLRDVLSRRRSPEVTWPRQIIMWAIKSHTKLSLPEIGRRLDNRDHTTVLYAVRRVQSVIDQYKFDVDEGWRDAIDQLTRFRSCPIPRGSRA